MPRRTARLPAALTSIPVRPGRCDYTIAFAPATASQAARLFERFYAGREDSAIDPGLLAELARGFGASIPPGGATMASLQGLLLRHRDAPERAVTAAAEELTAPPPAEAAMPQTAAPQPADSAKTPASEPASPLAGAPERAGVAAAISVRSARRPPADGAKTQSKKAV